MIVQFIFTLMIVSETKSKPASPFHFKFALPTCCDLTASTLGNISLLWIPPSVWQMMRGAIIIFSGILSVIFLKRKLRAHHWIGMLIVTGGLALVGMSGLVSGGTDKPLNITFVIGIGLVLLAQLIAATQMVIEEYFLTDEKIEYEPLNIVFMEGFYGVIFMVFIVLPILYNTPSGLFLCILLMSSCSKRSFPY